MMQNYGFKNCVTFAEMNRRKIPNEELGRRTIEEYRQARKFPVVIVLDNVRSMNNIGSVFRTADAFLVESIYLCGITATPPHREIRKTALGATDSVPWKYYNATEQALRDLKKEGYTLLAIEQVEGSISLENYQPESGKRFALIFGHEIHGVSQEAVDMSDECLEIPQFGTKHSFNIVVSTGIVLWDFYLKLKD